MLEARSLEGDSWLRWVHQIRRTELEEMMEYVPLARDATVLELGCGDGFQLDMLRERFDRVFSIDRKHRPIRAQGFSFSVAEGLPFPDRVFDLVVSNCVVEHFEDRPRAIVEALRVLRPGGYMAHAVPSPYWKVASLLLNPVGYPLRVGEKWWALRQARGNPQGLDPIEGQRTPQPGVLQVIGRWFYPPIHGTYPSHVAECRSYRRQRWIEIFTNPKLVQVAEVPLLSYTQFGFLRFRLIPLRRWLGRHGLDSTRAFILRKAE